MKILVPFKRVPDVASDGDKWVVNPFDEIAIEEALRMRERGEANEVVAVTIANQEGEEQVRHVFAMGVDRALRVQDERKLDPYSVARILKGVVEAENPVLVLMGKQAVDDDSNQVGQMLAGRLGWAQATFVSKIELSPDRKSAVCTREVDSGLEVMRVVLPAVITADLRLNEPRYVSLAGMMKAKRKSIELMDVGQGGIETLTTVIDTLPAPKRSAGVRVSSVEELVGKLREVEKLL